MADPLYDLAERIRVAIDYALDGGLTPEAIKAEIAETVENYDWDGA